MEETPKETPEPEAPKPEAPKPERLDEEGLPLDREPTLDDVRGDAGSGRTIAIGCTALMVLAVLGFWVLRTFVMR